MLHLLRVEMVINSPWMLSKNWLVQNLVRNVDSSLKFYMYPRFIQLIIQMHIGDLSTHTIKYISPALTKKVFANMRRVGKGFSGVETLLFEGMLAVREIAYEGIAEANDNCQWKFLIHTLLQSLSTKRTSWNESSSSMASAVFANMRRVGKGFSGVETPLFKGMLAVREIADEGIAEKHVQADDAIAAVQETVTEDVANDAIPSMPTPLILPSPPSHEIPSLSQLEIITLKARVKRLEMANKVKSSKLRHLKKVGTSQRIESSNDVEDVFNQGRMIDDLDKDEGVELAEKQAEIYHLDLDHPSKVLKVSTATSQVSAASATISAAKLSIPVAAPTVVAAYTRRRKGVIIRDP
nr:hypothetical protein [Tanacetum cinerariifolium]